MSKDTDWYGPTNDEKKNESETQQKEKVCVCQHDHFYPLNRTVEYSGIEISLFDTMLRVRSGSTEESFDSQDYVIINYCPICGRKL